MTTPPSSLAPERSFAIAQARRHWIDGEAGDGGRHAVAPWLTRSWQRCLAAGHRPQQRVSFDPVAAPAARHAVERNRELVEAARPVIDQLSRAIAETRYFAVLTDARGIVVDIGALPVSRDAQERRAFDIARIGVDLSERAVGTSAIGTALAERESVWLHRGEHFFDDTGIYTCAGAPLFGPRGDCIGMLDLTGVNVTERPELRHLAVQSARSIENALVAAAPCELLLAIDWPGHAPGGAGGGLLCIDEDGSITGANAAARQMLHQPLGTRATLHCNDLFAVPTGLLFDAARRGDARVELPLWSGLRVQAHPRLPPGRGLGLHLPPEPGSADGDRAAASDPAPAGRRLRDAETALIRRAVDEAHGNVSEAARALGIGRATVYRKLAQGKARAR